ncbi:hypothetical protein BJY54_002698 [Streptomyces nodosus]|uniref:Uncharacterized protein n=1 Tax=Streptomyces nodosus TaxID=40318 RepID=A0A0B5DCH5_9ACTN|nr:hypothetical protein SNOD_13690 [Streptomyces nodosus]MBB4792086.1 hypothetical protein [Streptomyces nodosus]
MLFLSGDPLRVLQFDLEGDHLADRGQFVRVRYMVGEKRGPVGGTHVPRQVGVLESNGETVQRADGPAPGQLPGGLGGAGWDPTLESVTISVKGLCTLTFSAINKIPCGAG